MHPAGEEDRTGHGHEAAQGIAYEHRGALDHLFEKALELPGPEPVVERAMAPVPRLAGVAKAHEVQGVDAPAGLGERGGVAAPVTAGCAEAMDEHQGRGRSLAEDTPVAGMALPMPGPVLSPMHPRRGRLEIQSRWCSHSGRHG